MFSVNDLYKSTQANNLPLLSSYTATFWQEYVDNYDDYDSLFNRLYKSFVYFLQDDGENIQTVRNRFVKDVENHLRVNHKKYSELYRIHNVSDIDNPITAEFMTTENMDRDTSYDKGSRTDSTTTDIGAQTNSNTNKVSPYDTENFFNDRDTSQSLGARHDGETLTSGAQHDSSTEDYIKTKEGFTNSAVSVMNKQKVFWNSHEFYEYIFKEISKELLLVC